MEVSEEEMDLNYGTELWLQLLSSLKFAGIRMHDFDNTLCQTGADFLPCRAAAVSVVSQTQPPLCLRIRLQQR